MTAATLVQMIFGELVSYLVQVVQVVSGQERAHPSWMVCSCIAIVNGIAYPGEYQACTQLLEKGIQIFLCTTPTSTKSHPFY